jgi:uncharacterized protein YciI
MQRYSPAVPYFVVTRGPGAGWDHGRPLREQDAWDEHAAFMDGLAENGFIVLGGPLGGGPTAMHVVEAGSEAEVRTRLDADPWEPMGVLRTVRIEPWEILLRG